MNQVTDLPTFVLAVDPAVTHEPPPAPLNHSPGASIEHDLRSSMNLRTFMEVQVSDREFQHNIRAKTMSLDALDRVRGKV